MLWARRSVTDICIRPLSFLQTSSIISGVIQISWFAQMFALGPRLILSVRDYHAELVANSDEGTAMTTIPGGYTCAIYQW